MPGCVLSLCNNLTEHPVAEPIDLVTINIYWYQYARIALLVSVFVYMEVREIFFGASFKGRGWEEN